MNSRGFTLIELLVVIAMIGILAAIVLASLGTARNKGIDAAIKTELSNIRNAADQYFLNNNSSYGTAGSTLGSCAGPAAGSAIWVSSTVNMTVLLADIAAKAGGASNMDCGVSTALFSVAVRLPGGGYWCVDNTGRASATATATGLAYTSLNAVGTAGAHNGPGATRCN